MKKSLFPALAAGILLCLAGCLNPVGFPIDLKLTVDGEIDVNIPGKSTTKPDGTESGNNTPNRPPAAHQGLLIMKNVTGGEKAKNATITVTRAGKNYGPIIVESGYEKSLTLDMTSAVETVTVSVVFNDPSSPKNTSKVMVRGQLSYIYFYYAKDGTYKIHTGNEEPVNDIDYNNHDDGGNTGDGDNNDNNGRPNPGEGDTSDENDPRTVLPPGMKSDYGIVIVHNISGSKALSRVLFDQGTGDSTRHYEMNPGPRQGNKRSIILKRGIWRTTGFWGILDNERTTFAPFEVKPAGAHNIVNYLFFYKGTDGSWHLTDRTDDDPATWTPPLDQNDYEDNSGNGGGGGGNTVTNPGEGNTTNQGTDSDRLIDIGSWDYATRQAVGILTVKNLSTKGRITAVTFDRNNPEMKHYPDGGSPFTVNQGRDRSIILKKSPALWDITVTYVNTADGTTHTLKTHKNISPVGITRYINYLYFYKGTDGNFHLTPLEYDPATTFNDGKGGEDDDTPPDSGKIDQGGGGGGGGGGGTEEGATPGALTDDNRSRYGLLILKNLSDVDLDMVTFSQAAQPSGAAGVPADWPKSFDMDPGPRKSDQRSIVLGPSDWATVGTWADGDTPSRNITIAAGTISYAYFYKTRSDSYDITTSWSPPPANAAPDNYDPGGIKNDDEDWIHVINTSNTYTIQGIEYYAAGWCSVSIPNQGGQIAPQGESGPDLAVPKNTWSFRFRIVGKGTYGTAISKTYDNASQRWIIRYNDALEDVVNIPVNSGLVRILNNSSYTVEGFNYYNKTGAASRVEVSSSSFEPAGPIGTGDRAERTVMDLVAGVDEYVIQVLLSKGAVQKSVDFVRVLRNQIVQLVLDDETTGGGGGITIDEPEYEGGGLVVTNSYTGVHPMKIFKIILKQEEVVAGVTQEVEKLTIDRTSNPIQKGQQWPVEHIPEGVYKMYIVAGVYIWPVYTSGIATISGGAILTEATITYNCGTMLIPEGYRKFYYFNVPYGQEKDMYGRQGVHFQVAYSIGNDVYPISYVEFVIPPNISQWGKDYWQSTNGPSETAVYDDPSLHFKGDPVNRYMVWPGGPPQNVYTGIIPTPDQYIVYRNGTVLGPNHTRLYDFYLPPGKYWVRARNAQGYWEGYGANSANYSNRWLIIDATAADGMDIYLTVGNTEGCMVYGLPAVISISGKLMPRYPYNTNNSYGSPTSTLRLSNVNIKTYEVNASGARISPALDAPFTVNEATGEYTVRNLPSGRRYEIVPEFDFLGGHYGDSAGLKGKKQFLNEAAMAATQTGQNIEMNGYDFGVYGVLRGSAAGSYISGATVQVMRRTAGVAGTTPTISELAPALRLDGSIITATTQNNGQFHLLHVPPGEYYLKVTSGAQTLYGPPAYGTHNAIPFTVVATWYGTTSVYATQYWGDGTHTGWTGSGNGSANVTGNSLLRFDYMQTLLP